MTSDLPEKDPLAQVQKPLSPDVVKNILAELDVNQENPRCHHEVLIFHAFCTGWKNCPEGIRGLLRSLAEPW